MYWLISTIGLTTAFFLKRKYSNHVKDTSLTRISMDWRHDDAIMVVEDGHGERFTVYERGAYWYLSETDEKLPPSVIKALLKLKMAYLDDVKALLKKPS